MTAASPYMASELSDELASMTTGRETALAVAVSGGADSMALAILLGQWCRTAGIPLTALTVDHGLRPAAAEEARQVESWLAAYDIPHVTLRWREAPDGNLQEQARLARYRLMGEWCQAHHVRKLFLAHHQDDQAETFLIRLFRGSGIDGLAAMKRVAGYPVFLPGGDRVSLCRPLLSVPKARLVATLTGMAQPWIEDPTNRDDSYSRVKVRKLLAQTDIEGLNAERLARTAARMGRVQSLLRTLTDQLDEAGVVRFREGYAEVARPVLRTAHEEIALRLLARLVREMGGGSHVPRLARLEAFYHRLKDEAFAGQTLGGVRIAPLPGDRLRITREAAGIADVTAIGLVEGICWDGRGVIRSARLSGRVRRLGPSEWQRACAQQPALKKWKLPRVVRDTLPCLVTDDDRVILPDFAPGFEEAGFTVTFAAE